MIKMREYFGGRAEVTGRNGATRKSGMKMKKEDIRTPCLDV